MPDTRRRLPEDGPSKRKVDVRRMEDGRERHIIPVTVGGRAFALVVMKHPGTEAMGVKIAAPAPG